MTTPDTTPPPATPRYTGRDGEMKPMPSKAPEKRPFSDALAEQVINGQVKEIDRLHAELAQLRAMRETANRDWADARTHLQKLVRDAGGMEFEVEGDSYGVPTIETLADWLVAKLTRERATVAALRAIVDAEVEREDKDKPGDCRASHNRANRIQDEFAALSASPAPVMPNQRQSTDAERKALDDFTLAELGTPAPVVPLNVPAATPAEAVVGWKVCGALLDSIKAEFEGDEVREMSEEAVEAVIVELAKRGHLRIAGEAVPVVPMAEVVRVLQRAFNKAKFHPDWTYEEGESTVALLAKLTPAPKGNQP